MYNTYINGSTNGTDAGTTRNNIKANTIHRNTTEDRIFSFCRSFCSGKLYSTRRHTTGRTNSSVFSKFIRSTLRVRLFYFTREIILIQL